MTDGEFRKLRDHEEIRQLVARYNFTFDSRDDVGHLRCWTEDGFVERLNSKPSCRGHAQLGALVRDFPVNGRHLTTDLIIEIEGDRATIENYCLYLDMGPPCDTSMMGIYRDKLVRTADGWKFAERIFEPLTIRASETSGAFMDQVAASERA